MLLQRIAKVTLTQGLPEIDLAGEKVKSPDNKQIHHRDLLHDTKEKKYCRNNCLKWVNDQLTLARPADSGCFNRNWDRNEVVFNWYF